MATKKTAVAIIAPDRERGGTNALVVGDTRESSMAAAAIVANMIDADEVRVVSPPRASRPKAFAWPTQSRCGWEPSGRQWKNKPN